MHIEICGRKIGNKLKPYIVAELSANHNGSLTAALETIKKAKECGADAIKIQTYNADDMTIDCDEEDFIIKDGLWDGYKLYELYKEASTPYEWHEHIFNYAKKIGITIFSTPFSEEGVDFLSKLNTPAFKVASFELCDLPLIKHIAKQNKPIIMSTGMSTKKEIVEAVDTARTYGNNEIVLLHCVSSYPAPIEEANVSQINELARFFKLPTGLSDHTLGTAVSLAAVASGACLIEKHFILDRKINGPDSKFSINPKELRILCKDSELVWKSIGKATFEKQKSEEKNEIFKRSIYFVNNLSKDHIITAKDIKRIRPGNGLPPKFYNYLLGKKIIRSVKRGQPVTFDSIEN